MQMVNTFQQYSRAENKKQVSPSFPLPPQAVFQRFPSLSCFCILPEMFIDMQAYVCIYVYSLKNQYFKLCFFNFMSNTWIHSLCEKLKHYKQAKVPTHCLPRDHHCYKLNFYFSWSFCVHLHTHPWWKYVVSFSVFPFLPHSLPSSFSLSLFFFL